MQGAAGAAGVADTLSLRTARGRRFMIPIMLAAMQNPLNSSLIVTALIPIGLEFRVGPLQTGWLISGLYLSSAVGQTVMGKLVDVLGARRMILAGLVISMCAATLGALAPSLGWLIAARVLLGLGNSAGYPGAMAMLRRANGEGSPVPTGSLSLLTIGAQISVSAGPALSGVIVMLFGWRAIFGINIPLCLATVALVLLWLPNDNQRPEGGKRSVLRQLDVVGIALFSLAMTMLMLSAETFVPRAVSLGAAILFAGAFVARELTVERPFLDLRLIRRTPGLGRTIARQVVTMGVIYTFFYATAEWLEDAHGATAQVVGLMMLPNAAVAMLTAATVARRVAPRVGLIAGSVGAAIASALFLGLNAASPLFWVAIALGIAGTQNGFYGVANQAALYAQTPAGYVGLTAGIFRTMQYVGGIIAATLMGLAFGSHAGDGGLHLIMLGMGVSCVVLAIAAAIDHTVPERGARPAPASPA